MMEKPQPDVLGFERIETQLVREAIRAVGDIYAEEVSRNAIRHYVSDKGKQSEFITSAWAYPTKYDLYHLLNKDNLTSVWKDLRESKATSAAVLNTAVKLRGMYGVTDWQQIINNLSGGLDILRRGEHSVMDEVATNPVMGNAKPADLLDCNTWVVVIVLLSYLPLTGLPTTLQLLLRAGGEAPKGGVVS